MRPYYCRAACLQEQNKWEHKQHSFLARLLDHRAAIRDSIHPLPDSDSETLALAQKLLIHK